MTMDLDDELSRLPEGACALPKDASGHVVQKTEMLEAVWCAALIIGELCPPEEFVTVKWLKELRDQAIIIEGFASAVIDAAHEQRSKERPPEPDPVLDKHLD
jgi:hypothetical protein